MDRLNRDDLKVLLEHEGGPCISIYLPTHRAGADVRQDPIRLKNLWRQAEEALVQAGRRPALIKALGEPVQKLEKDTFFWQHQGDGLAILRSENFFKYIRTSVRFEELAIVGERFHIKPLIAVLQDEGRFYVLALSKNAVRLIRGDNTSIEEVNLDHVPQSLSETLRYWDFEAGLQFHTRTASRGTERAAMYHGHSGVVELEKAVLLEHFRKIDAGLKELLRNDRAPLVLAGVEYLFPIYREANTYPYLLEEGVPGNPEGLKPGALFQKARQVVKPVFEKWIEEAVHSFREMEGTSRVSTQLTEVVPAAYHSRVDSLFVALGTERWGRFDPKEVAVSVHEAKQDGDTDLVDYAAVHTLLQGGQVFALPPERMPDPAPVAAVYRY